MGIDQLIREEARRYLDGELSFEEFEDWFLDETWDLHGGDEPVPEAVYTIERYIAEFTGGHRDEDELREDLERLAPVWAIRREARTDSATAVGRRRLTTAG